MKKNHEQYLKVVEWSDEDQCYVGTAPGLFIGGVHGRNEKKVFEDLCAAVEEAIDVLEKEGKPLPAATANKQYSGKIILRIPADLHKTITLKASQVGESINKFIKGRLQKIV